MKRKIIPFYYLIEQAKCSCLCCLSERKIENIFAAHGTETTAVNLVPLTKPMASLWDVPIRYRKLEATTAFCSLCVPMAKRTPLPPEFIPPSPTHSNFYVPPKVAGAKKPPVKLEDVL